jgi:membrane protease YdiL (CAAX protease family)
LDGPRQGASDPPPPPSRGDAGPARDTPAREGAPGAAPREDPVGDVLLGLGLALALAWLCARVVPEAYVAFGYAIVWAGVPIALDRAQRRALEPEGIAWKSPWRTAGAVARTAALILPLFVVAYHLRIQYLAPGGGPAAPRWSFPGADVAIAIFVAELATHALPEEIFFRGFVQPRLAARFPARPRRVLGLPLTPAVVLAAALFALAHLAFSPHAARLLTFFPGLVFGALREETGDVAAPAIFHALCNATLFTLERGYAGA